MSKCLYCKLVVNDDRERLYHDCPDLLGGVRPSPTATVWLPKGEWAGEYELQLSPDEPLVWKGSRGDLRFTLAIAKPIRYSSKRFLACVIASTDGQRKGWQVQLQPPDGVKHDVSKFYLQRDCPKKILCPECQAVVVRFAGADVPGCGDSRPEPQATDEQIADATKRLEIPAALVQPMRRWLSTWALAGFPVRPDEQIEQLWRAECDSRTVGGMCKGGGCPKDGALVPCKYLCAMATATCPRGSFRATESNQLNAGIVAGMESGLPGRNTTGATP
jgi:hypothetical protein